MSNILILSASPRAKGNSNILCDEFTRGAEEAGHQVEKLMVSRKNVVGCLGCNACMKNGGTCVHKNDDMAEIRDKMLATDVIVLSSPIYFYTMAAQMKLVLDRTYAFFNQLEGKTFYFVITCAGPGEQYTETMLSALRGYTCCIPEAKEGGYVLGYGTSEAGDVKSTPAMQQAYELGKAV